MAPEKHVYPDDENRATSARSTQAWAFQADVDAFEQCSKAIFALLAQSGPGSADQTVPGTVWSIPELLHHLIDGEVALITATGPAEAFPKDLRKSPIEVFRVVLKIRLRQLLSGVDPNVPIASPYSATAMPLQRVLQLRTSELWHHEQQLRELLGLAKDEESLAANVISEHNLPYVCPVDDADLTDSDPENS